MTNFEKYKDEVLRMLEISECEVVPGVKNGTPRVMNVICTETILIAYRTSSSGFTKTTAKNRTAARIVNTGTKKKMSRHVRNAQ